MNKLSFTPGPWEVIIMDNQTIYPGIESTNPNADKSTLVIYGESREDSGVRGSDEKNRLANAHLIAAAPDMISALQSIVDCFDCEDGMVSNACILAAKASINKALNK